MAVAYAPHDQRPISGAVLMNWSEKYLAIPFQDHGRTSHGLDCWGLAVLVYRQELGIILPDYSQHYISVGERAEIAALIREGKSSWDQVSDYRPYDLALFDVAGLSCHIGVIVDSRHFLHAPQHGWSRIEKLDAPHWQPRVVGVYRYGGQS